MIISTPPATDLSESLLPEGPEQDEPQDEQQNEQRLLHLDAQQHGQRLDRILASAMGEFSRSYLQQRIEAGDVLLDGRVCSKTSAKVRVGQKVQVTLRASAQSQAFVPQDMPIESLYVDEHIRVIHKPAGLVVHPAPGNWQGTLLNGLLALDAAAKDLPRAGIVHRLDKDTSGLMVVARSRVAQEALVRMMAAREISRQYIALAHRAWQGQAQREVHTDIGRDPNQRLRMAVVDASRHPGKNARTSLDCLHSTEQVCVVRCTLHTGRTHQIRVHMAHIGHPLLGDSLYGGASLGGLQRQALHAWRLAFEHPINGQPLAWTQPLPPDMVQAMQALHLQADLPPPEA